MCRFSIGMATAIVDPPINSSAATSTHQAVELQDEEFCQETRKIVAACVLGIDDDLNDYQKRIVSVVNGRIEETPQFFESTCQRLNLTTTNFNSRLVQVWEGMFSDDKYNWGRITAFLAFCQYVCAYSQSHGLPSTVMDSIPPWATVFIRARLQHWIISEGGWVRSLAEV